MISGVAIYLLKEWYRQARWLGLLLILLGTSIYLGGHPEAATVYPKSVGSWIMGLIGVFVFSVYSYLHIRWIAKNVGHYREVEREEAALRILKVFLFYLLFSSLTWLFVRMDLWWISLLLWLALFLYPIAAVVDNVSELDNLLSSLEAWKRNPDVILEYFLVTFILLVTAYFLEVSLGSAGYVFSILLTVGFTVPFSLTLLALSYLLKYPMVKRALQI